MPEGVARQIKAAINPFSKLLQKLFDLMPYLAQCHARVREILSYLHIPKTTTICYMYEANYSD